jgi:hypothetical protein
MKMIFDVGESAARFHRDPFLGGAALVVDGQKTTLARLRDPTTHFTYELVTQWTVAQGGHTIEIVKTRARLLGGMRPATYVARVDGKEVSTARGF